MQTINDRIRIILDDSGLTRTAFGESLKVSQQYISKLIRTGNPSDLLISDICEKYDVSEDWLRYGIGEKYAKKTMDQELTEFAADLRTDEEDSFTRRLIRALSKLSVEQWEVLEQIAKDLAQKK